MGPLAGIRIVEFAGIGPGPFAAMLLSDMGAEVIRIDRKGGRTPHKTEVTYRGRPAVALDMKKPEAVEAALKLIDGADALIEGFRPGVMERLGVGPDVCLKRNPKLVYGRMTGWGQTGPLAKAAGHDINYIALTGALHGIGNKGGKPVPPLNLVGDFGGGALYLAFGRRLRTSRSEEIRQGPGHRHGHDRRRGLADVDVLRHDARWACGRTSAAATCSIAAPISTTPTRRRTASSSRIGSIEPQFYALLLEKTGITDEAFTAQMDRDAWPSLKDKIAAVIKTKTRDEWDALMLGSDVCYAPVLSLGEAPKHPHNVARKTFVEVDGVTQPAPAPRFSRTVPEVQGPPQRRRQRSGARAMGLLERRDRGARRGGGDLAA